MTNKEGKEALTAEQVLKSKINPSISVLNNADYTFNKVIEAMEEFASLRVAEKDKEIEPLKAEVSQLKEELKSWRNKVSEVAESRKENGWSDRELEQAYAIGLLNQKDLNSDVLAEQLKISLSEKKFEMLKKTLLSFRESGELVSTEKEAKREESDHRSMI